MLALTGCTPTRHAVPAALAGSTQLPGFADVKFWADEPSAAYATAIAAKDAQLKAAVAAGKLPPGNLTHADFLAISGGVDQGAFAAGLLRGWSGRGTRPTFGVVSGVSAGALAAPFAFLGPVYDDALEDIFTKLSAGDLLTGHEDGPAACVAVHAGARARRGPSARLGQRDRLRGLLPRRVWLGSAAGAAINQMKGQ